MSQRIQTAGRSGPRVALAAAAAIALAPAAEAHLVTTGMGPVYDGIAHFFLSPDDVLCAVAVALLAGMRGPAAGRCGAALLPAGWLLGGMAGAATPLAPASHPILAAASLLILGILLAADRPLPLAVIAALTASLGFAHGFFNGAAMREAGGFTAILQLGGVAFTLAVIGLLAAALAVSLGRPPWRIGLRVAGSWTAAIGLLLLGWALKPVR
jgi:hydrogenase/urease accessory protein HupE